MIIESKNQSINGFGYFKLNPKRPGLKRRISDNWAVINVDNQISNYYCWWMKRQYGFDLHRPMYGSHVTIFNDKDRIKDKTKFLSTIGKYENMKIKFSYSPVVEQHWKFFVLPVKCEQMEELRYSVGLPILNFHITIGRFK